MSGQPVDYQLLSRAVSFYGQRGFKQIPVPYLVSTEAILATCPGDKGAFATKYGELVGSAEQSFIQMMLDGTLPPGRYQAITPCFRDEPVLDELHHQHFMKLELIDTRTGTTEFDYVEKAFSMREKAYAFFHHEGRASDIENTKHKVLIERRAKGPKRAGYQVDTDLYSKTGLQLGSYGIREYRGHKWIFGTGCAEPRCSHWLRTRKTT